MNKTDNRLNLYRLAGLALIILLLLVQPNTGVDLRWHWLSSFVLVYFLVLNAGQLKKHSDAALLAVLLGFGFVNLWAVWLSGISDYILLGGLLPFSDASGYFVDAQNILLGNEVSEFSGKRPIYAAMLSAITGIFGENLHHILIVQTTFLSGVLALLAIRSKQIYGAVFTAFFMATIWLFYRRFIGETMTENLGLFLGCLGLCFMWRVCDERKSNYTLFVGIFCLCVGLVSRAGPFFILPTLSVWAGFIFRDKPKGFSFSAFGVCVLAIVSGFLLNRLLVQGLHIQSTMFSNFAYTLYGLIGGGDWKLALEVNPALLGMSLEDQSKEVYRMTWDLFSQDPTLLLKGAVRATSGLAMTMYLFGYSFHPNAPALIPAAVLTVLAVIGLVVIYPDKGSHKNSMILAVLVGCFASAPFVPPWDADMMRAYAVVIPFLSVFPAIGFVWIVGANSGSLPPVVTVREARTGRYSESAALGFTILACLAMPVFLRGMDANKVSLTEGPFACPHGEFAADIVLFSGSQIRLVDEDQVFDLRQFGKKVLKQPGSIFSTDGGIFPSLHTFGSHQILERAYRENVSADIRETIGMLGAYKVLSYAYYKKRGSNETVFAPLLFAKSGATNSSHVVCAKKIRHWPYVAVTN